MKSKRYAWSLGIILY